jgi:bifunctional DNA-binding transcriptional regulator/antitoxin component of YhaV-PrlF toxin-antitoxin module
LSQKYEIRRPHFLGNKEASCRVILPAKLVECVGIMKGDYLRIYDQDNKLVIERMANQVDDNGGKNDRK